MFGNPNAEPLPMTKGLVTNDGNDRLPKGNRHGRSRLLHFRHFNSRILHLQIPPRLYHQTVRLFPRFEIIGPLQDTITWYKIRHTGTQTAHWDIQNKDDLSLSDLSRFVLDVPVRSLRTSMADFASYPGKGLLLNIYIVLPR